MPRARLRTGQVQAHARMRDESGRLLRLKATRQTETETTRALEDQADAIRCGQGLHAGPI